MQVAAAEICSCVFLHTTTTTVPKFSVPTDEFHVEPWVFQVAEIVIFSQFCLRSPTLSGTISSIVPLRTDVDPRSIGREFPSRGVD